MDIGLAKIIISTLVSHDVCVKNENIFQKKMLIFEMVFIFAKFFLHYDECPLQIKDIIL